jgi:hypothetical protein
MAIGGRLTFGLECRIIRTVKALRGERVGTMTIAERLEQFKAGQRDAVTNLARNAGRLCEEFAASDDPYILGYAYELAAAGKLALTCSVCGLSGGEHYTLCPRSADYYSPERERSDALMSESWPTCDDEAMKREAIDIDYSDRFEGDDDAAEGTAA